MLDWQKIKAAALKARYTENPTDAELRGDSEAKKGGFAMDLTQYLEKAGPFIGPRGGKWADAKHTIPWGEEKSAGGEKQAFHAELEGGQFSREAID